MKALDVDFLVFSGHKVFGPTGVGALYAKASWLEQLPPWQGGGNMISDVTFTKTKYQDYPQRFEAGTQSIADVIGLGAALDYLQGVGLPAIAADQHSLLDYATHALEEIPGLRKRLVQPELFLVGEIEGQVVATAMAGYDGHRGWIDDLAVDPAQCRRGLGRAIVVEAERLLAALGCPKINLQVRDTISKSLGFYQRIGFCPDDVVSLGKRLESDVTPAVIFARLRTVSQRIKSWRLTAGGRLGAISDDRRRPRAPRRAKTN